MSQGKMYQWELREELDNDRVLDGGEVTAEDLLSALVWVRAEVGLSTVEPFLVEEMQNEYVVWALWPTGKTLRVEGQRR